LALSGNGMTLAEKEYAEKVGELYEGLKVLVSIVLAKTSFIVTVMDWEPAVAGLTTL